MDLDIVEWPTINKPNKTEKKQKKTRVMSYARSIIIGTGIISIVIVISIITFVYSGGKCDWLFVYFRCFLDRILFFFFIFCFVCHCCLFFIYCMCSFFEYIKKFERKDFKNEWTTKTTKRMKRIKNVLDRGDWCVSGAW